jgi:hypothetical protein
MTATTLTKILNEEHNMNVLDREVNVQELDRIDDELHNIEMDLYYIEFPSLRN